MHEPDFVDECYAEKDLSLLKKLTLVIPTYNRNYYLSRCLWYHAHFPFGEIIVADSSPEEKKVVNRETVQKVREMFGANIRYLEYEPETEKYGGDIYRKWGDAVQHVETEYSVICTDKEFLIPTTVVSSLHWLELHSEYIASDGGYLYFGAEYLRSKFILNPIFSIRDYGRISEEQGEAKERFLSAMENKLWNRSLLNSITRTRTHKELYHNFLEFNISDIRFGELYLGFGGYFCGKYHHDPNNPYSVRDMSHNTSGYQKQGGGTKESSSSRYPTYDVYMQDGMWYDLAHPYINGVLQLAIKYTYMTEEEANIFISEKICYEKIAVFNQKLPRILERIYREPFINTIWHKSNSSLKSLLDPILYHYRIIPAKRKLLIISEESWSKELCLVHEIITNTLMYHELDVVCF